MRWDFWVGTDRRLYAEVHVEVRKGVLGNKGMLCVSCNYITGVGIIEDGDQLGG